MQPQLTLLDCPPPSAAPFEIVERKGVGHPDTICDALTEGLSHALCRFYIERFGLILHHNVDKALLWGGAARPAFGDGEVLEPIEIYIAGRATREARGVTVPVEVLAIDSSRAWLRANLPALNPERHLRIHTLIRPSSPDLVALFERQRATGVALANDTSFGVGFAPLDPLERAVLAVERRLNAPATRAAHPEIGPDVKVMGARTGHASRMTVACAMVGRHLRDLADYLAAKARVRALALEAVRETAGTGAVEVDVNTADGETADSIYLTVTGTSAEGGDDGQAGRGNRANGLITPYRPMSLEALAGKNPVNHVGKLYNVLAREISEELVAELDGVEHAECYLLSQIGRSIADPELAHVRLAAAEPAIVDGHRSRAAEIVGDHLLRVESLTERFVRGEIGV
ncbi:MAG TPA: methionine adenosyltransferase, partial [Burkholderiales bacterium]|nr:methionine adenosyltransferase [Burkholderiales bacterium]